jgi:hypothetical protein
MEVFAHVLRRQETHRLAELGTIGVPTMTPAVSGRSCARGYHNTAICAEDAVNWRSRNKFHFLEDFLDEGRRWI